MILTKLNALALVPLTLALTAAQAFAAPTIVPLQGVVTNADGILLEDEAAMVVAFYAEKMGGEPVWTDTMTVGVDQGRFEAFLGTGVELESMVFRDNPQLWLGVAVNGDPEMERIPFGTGGYAAFATHAGDAQTLQGQTLADLDYEAAAGLAINEETRTIGLASNNIAILSAPTWSNPDKPYGSFKWDTVVKEATGVVSKGGHWVTFLEDGAYRITARLAVTSCINGAPYLVRLFLHDDSGKLNPGYRLDGGKCTLEGTAVHLAGTWTVSATAGQSMTFELDYWTSTIADETPIALAEEAAGASLVSNQLVIEYLGK